MASPKPNTTAEASTASDPILLGVLNLSPESMVTNSIAQTPAEILARADKLRSAGVEILDVGGRSITPDASMIDDAEEQRRLLPAIKLLAANGYRVSADTWSSDTAIAALDAGASVINFTGQRTSDALLARVRDDGATLSLTYMPYGDAYAMRDATPVPYRIDAILDHLEPRVARARDAGVETGKLIVDPNLGIIHPSTSDYAKTHLQLEVLAHSEELRSLGCPLFLYAARKPERLARILIAELVLRAKPEYVRTHEPQTIRELQAAARDAQR
jgi:dihydropteroate synthase